MKSILLTSLVFLLFNPFSCTIKDTAKSKKVVSSTSKISEKNINRFNPYNFVSETNNIGEYWYNEESLRDDDYSVRSAILKCAPFEYTTIPGTFSENHFEFEYRGKSTSFFGGQTRADMTFYDNGYVVVKNSGTEYVYKFNATLAENLFNFASQKVFNYYEERRVAEAAAKEILSAVNLEYALNVISNMNNAEFVFWFYPSEETHNEYYANLNDDGTITNLLANATYTSTDRKYASQTINNEIQISQRNENGLYWSFNMNESLELVKIYASVTDSFDRNYTYAEVYKIDRNTAKTVFDKAIELRDAYFASNN